MLISVEEGVLDEYLVVATPQEYDGSPGVNTFRMDYAPRSVHPDRLALAAYLLFRPWASGPLQLPSPVSPALAEAIAALHAVCSVQPGPVDLTPRTGPPGRRPLRLAWRTDHSSEPPPGGMTVNLLRSDEASGALRTAQSVWLPSNAFMLAETEARELDVALAIGCVLAGDLDVRELHLPVAVPEPLSRLLHRAGLSLA